MKSWITKALIEIRYSYWFIPTVMAISAIILAAALVAVDLYYFSEVPQSLNWLFSSKPEGARAILSTVAGSTITVAGVVFSMTIMSVSHATSNYGSRLLLKFLKDRNNQITLGTFTATFIYCLLVLRTVSNGDIGAGVADFVPHVALLGAIFLALTSVMVLIAFIHHVPDTIYIGNVAAERGTELSQRLTTMFQDDHEDANKPFDFESSSSVLISVLSNGPGYIQTLHIEDLSKFCCKHSMQVEVLKEPGDFVIKGEAVMRYIREPACDLEQPNDELLSNMGIGTERTPAQDSRFLIEELKQIAIRALSSGINDPFTAIPCIDWLGAALGSVMNQGARPIRYHDNEGSLRVVMPEFDFQRLTDIVFDDLRPHVCEDITTCLSTADLMVRLIKNASDNEPRKILENHAQKYLNVALENFNSSEDRGLLKQRFDYRVS